MSTHHISRLVGTGSQGALSRLFLFGLLFILAKSEPNIVELNSLVFYNYIRRVPLDCIRSFVVNEEKLVYTFCVILDINDNQEVVCRSLYKNALNNYKSRSVKKISTK